MASSEKKRTGNCARARAHSHQRTPACRKLSGQISHGAARLLVRGAAALRHIVAFRRRKLALLEAAISPPECVLLTKAATLEAHKAKNGVVLIYEIFMPLKSLALLEMSAATAIGFLAKYTYRRRCKAFNLCALP